MQDNVVNRDEIEKISRFDPLEPYNSDYVRGFIYGHDRLLNEIRKLPSVNPQEPKIGHWIDHQEGRWIYAKCSECGIGMGHTEYDYCPNCGAKMESEEI